MEPFFSVIVPVYNKAPHIARALSSVFKQSYKSYELIVVNDASTDNSLEEIRKAVEGKGNVSVLERNEPGPGGYAARNTGVAESHAPWIAFLDADDEWEPGLLDEFYRLIRKYPDCGFLGTAQRRVSSEGEETLDPYSESVRIPEETLFNIADYAMAGSRGHNPIQTSTVAVDKKLYEKIGGFPDRRCVRGGDRDTWLRLLTETDLVWTPFIGGTYFRDSVNMVTRNLAAQTRMCNDYTYNTILKDTGLNKKYGKELSRSIKAQSNYERKQALKKCIKAGELKTADVNRLYFSSDPIYKFCLLVLSLFPRFLQIGIVRIGLFLFGMLKGRRK